LLNNLSNFKCSKTDSKTNLPKKTVKDLAL
jgi:hypothetical protein